MSDDRPERRVRLRDVTAADADLLDDWDADPASAGEYNDFGLPRAPVDRVALANGPLRSEGKGLQIVERIADGRPIGTVTWHEVHYGPGTHSNALNFGIALVPEARGHGYGSEAQALLAEWLFANTPVNRVEASTDVENVAEQRSLERAGFTREGIVRGAQFRAGGYHDLVTYSRLRNDP